MHSDVTHRFDWCVDAGTVSAYGYAMVGVTAFAPPTVSRGLKLRLFEERLPCILGITAFDRPRLFVIVICFLECAVCGDPFLFS